MLQGDLMQLYVCARLIVFSLSCMCKHAGKTYACTYVCMLVSECMMNIFVLYACMNDACFPCIEMYMMRYMMCVE